jgi:hypothetical protein
MIFKHKLFTGWNDPMGACQRIEPAALAGLGGQINFCPVVINLDQTHGGGELTTRAKAEASARGTSPPHLSINKFMNVRWWLGFEILIYPFQPPW